MQTVVFFFYPHKDIPPPPPMPNYADPTNPVELLVYIRDNRIIRKTINRLSNALTSIL